MYVCSCQAVTETQVERLIREGACDAGELIRRLALDAEGNCGACMHDPEWLLARLPAGRDAGGCGSPCGAAAACARLKRTRPARSRAG